MSKTLVAVVVTLIALLALHLGTRSVGNDDPAQAASVAGPAQDSVPPRAALTDSGGSGRRAAAPEGPATSPTATGDLRVEVRFASDGAPAADIGVYLRAAGHDLGVERRTDVRGEARFTGLPRSLVAVHVDRVPGASQVDLAHEDSTLVLIREGLTLRGRVVDLEHAGVAGAHVYRLNTEHHDVLQQVAVCGPDGAFEVRGLGDGVQLVARAAGYQPSELIGVYGGERAFELQLGARGHSLEGRVLDDAGRGVAWAWVLVGVDEDAREVSEGSSAVPGDGSRVKNLDREGILLRADAQGRFASHEVPAGHVVVAARPADSGSGAVAWTTLWMTSEGARDVELWLRPGAEVVGVVRDRSGRPIPGLELEAEWEGTPLLGQMEDDLGPFVSDRRAVSADDGSFRLRGLLPGDYDLRVRGAREELAREEVVLASGERLPWEPVIDARAALRVTLLDPTGSPLAGWRVVAAGEPGRTPAWSQRSTTTDGQGRAHLADLAEGVEHVVSVFAVTQGTRAPVALRRVVIQGSTALEFRLSAQEQLAAQDG